MTLRQRLTRRWPGAIRRRRACRAWWARAGASVRSWPGGGVGGISLAPGGSGNARPPRACPHRRPAGQGYGGAAARRWAGPRPPDVSRRQRRGRGAWTRRTVGTGWAFVFPLSQAVGGAGPGGRTPPPAACPPGPRQPLRRRAAAPEPGGSGWGPRRGPAGRPAARARGRASTAGLAPAPSRTRAPGPRGGARAGGTGASSTAAPPASGGGRVGPRATAERSAASPPSATPPSGRGPRPRTAGPAAATRHASRACHPGMPSGEMATRSTVNQPWVVPPVTVS